MLSMLFQGDALLQAIADDQPPHPRISEAQNRFDGAVVKVQTALLAWRADVLPQRGADGEFGSESAAAVRRFKIEELGVPPAEVIDDVGPRTVVRLDEIQAASERPPDPPPDRLPSVAGDVLVLADPSAAPDDQAAVLDAIEASGGTLELGLGSIGAVVSGGQDVVDALAELAASAGSAVSATIQPGDEAVLGQLDEEMAALVAAWLATFDPAFVAEQSDPSRRGGSWEFLGGSCLADGVE